MNPERIVVVGGPDAVSEGVAVALSEIAPVERLGGVNRYETAKLVAESLFGDPSVVYLAYGYSYPEAVSAAVAAGTHAGPLLLTVDDALVGFTRRYLASLSNVDVIVVGDSAAVGQAVLDELAAIPSVSSIRRISASDPSAISIAVSKATFPDGADLVYLATAGDYADALAGASLAGTNGAPVLLLTDSGLGAVDSEIQRLGVSETIVLGGPAAVPYSWILPMWNRAVGNTMPTWNSHG
jgi:putative cell wall-binding protein